MNILLPNPAIRSATKLLKALSNSHRLLILCQLLGSEKRVGELGELTGLGQSALSQHLARLRRDKLVKTRRESQTIFYSAANNDVDQVIHVLHELFCAPQSVNTSKPSPAGRAAARRR